MIKKSAAKRRLQPRRTGWSRG